MGVAECLPANVSRFSSCGKATLSGFQPSFNIQHMKLEQWPKADSLYLQGLR
jgi:hypothetical protein